jgi:4-amino-4-deoxy-L-arabinose transferase-like glycosyltransferase
MRSFFQKNRFLVLLLLTAFLLRLPSLFEPYWYGDEGIYLSVGLAINKGYLLYRDIFDNKPPSIYLLAAAAGGTIFWFKFFLTVNVLAAIYFFYRLAEKILSSPKAIKIATIAFALLTTIRLVEGNIVNAELFILLPTLLCLNLVLLAKDKHPSFWLLTGAILGLGLTVKANGLFDFLALMAFWVFFTPRKKISLSSREIFFTLGYLLPTLATTIFFLLRGALGAYFDACLLQMFGYLSSWETGSHATSVMGLAKSGLFLRGVILTVFLALLWTQKKLSSLLLFVAVWFAFCLFSAALSGRPYPHYLIQAIPPLSLTIGLLVIKNTKKTLAIIGSVFLLLVIFLKQCRFWTYPTLSYYRNFIGLATGQKDRAAYFDYFSPNLKNLYVLAEYAAAQTAPTDKIFIWADEPSLYPLAKRLPATAYVAAYHILDLKKEAEVIFKLTQELPKIIMVDQKKPLFPELSRLLNENYWETKRFEYFSVFQKRTF